MAAEVTAEQVEIERLREELQHAHTQLKTKEEKLQLAANYGVKLLNENKTLSEQYDTLMKEKDEAVQTLEEQVHRLKAEAKQHAAEQEYVTDLEAEGDRVRRENESLLKKTETLSKEAKELRNELARLQTIETEANNKIHVLETKTKQQETRIHELEEQVQCDIQSDAMDEELANAQAEVARLRGILSKLQVDKTESESMLAQLQQRYGASEELVADLRRVVEEKSEALDSARNEAERVKAELQTVQTKLDSYQSSNGEMGAGLDLFSEVEDKRQALEDRVARLQRQAVRSKKRIEAGEQQRKKLQGQLNMMAQMQSSKADETKLLRLEQALSQSRSELHTQQRQLKKLQQQLDESNRLLREHRATAGSNGDNAYVQYLQSELDEKAAQIRRLTNEVQTKSFLCISESRKVREYESQLHEAERRNEQLTLDLMEREMKLEEQRMLLEMKKEEEEEAAALSREKSDSAEDTSHDQRRAHSKRQKQRAQQEGTEKTRKATPAKSTAKASETSSFRRTPLAERNSNVDKAAGTPKQQSRDMQPHHQRFERQDASVSQSNDQALGAIACDLSPIAVAGDEEAASAKCTAAGPDLSPIAGSPIANSSIRRYRSARERRKHALATEGCEYEQEEGHSDVVEHTDAGGDGAALVSTPTRGNDGDNVDDGVHEERGTTAENNAAVVGGITRMKIAAPAPDNSVECNTQ